MNLPLDQPIRRAPVLWRQSGDQILLRRRGDPQLVVLAGTGVALWHAIAEPTTIAAVAAELADAHSAPLEQVSADLQHAIAALIADDVVVAS